MKKWISLLMIAALLLSICSVSAFAAEGDSEAPQPTVGPAETVFMYGGARAGIYDTGTDKYSYTVSYDYSADELTVNNKAVPGMTYDKSSNTLTVQDVMQPDSKLILWYMGNDFKLDVEGACAFSTIEVCNYLNFYGTSLNIIGAGTLTVNEKKNSDEAIHVFADGEDPLAGVDIADSVSVHLYSAIPEDEEDYAPVITVNASTIAPAQGAITIGGKAAPEAKSEQLKTIETDTVPVIEIEDRDRESAHGLQVKSKSDPDGVYSLEIMDDVIYIVNRWMYVDALDMWVVDRSFVSDRMKKETFEANYDYVYGMAPTPIDYMETHRINQRGIEGVKMAQDDDPGAVYIGVPTGAIWDWGGMDYPGNYEIHRVIWDEKQQYYADDPDFAEIDLVEAELAENGFHVVKETVDKPVELTVWSAEDPLQGFEMTLPAMSRKSDPDGLYVKVGTYSSSGETGVSVYKVHYNPESEEHYVMYDSYSEPECFYVSDASIESGEADFSYLVDMVSEYIWLRYLPKDYDINRDLSVAKQLKKTGDPDAVYAYKQWTHYTELGGEREEYGLIRLQYNADMGCYVQDNSFEEIEFYDLSYLDYMGYEFVMSTQPLQFVTTGSISLIDYPVYYGSDGSTYYADFGNNVFSYSDDDTVAIGGKTYYFGAYEPDLGIGELNSTEREVTTGTYRYWIEGSEYHHTGTQAEPVAYALWVNGEQITSEHLTVTCGKGTATYNPTKNTLTLDNAEITKGTDTDWTYSGVLSHLAQLTVIVKGNCTITETDGDGIGTYNSEFYQVGDVYYPAPYDLTVTGDGTLTIKESTMMYGYGLYCTGSLVIDGVTLEIDSAAAGVWATDLKMNNVNAAIESSTWYSGIVVNRGDFVFDNSTVTAKSSKGAGLLLGSDQVASILKVNSGELSLSGELGVQGIVDYSAVAVYGGKLSAEGSDKAFDDTFLADGAKNIIMGEGIGVTSGSLDGKSVVISAAAAGGFTVSGSFTSYLDASGTVTFELLQDDAVKYTASAAGNTGTYAFENVAAGEYTLRVSKANHVTRDYAITVSADMTQDVKICPKGDVSGDGKVTTKDYAMANAHAQKVSLLTGYALQCGDVLKGDGKITTADAARINAAAQKVDPLW